LTKHLPFAIEVFANSAQTFTPKKYRNILQKDSFNKEHKIIKYKTSFFTINET